MASIFNAHERTLGQFAALLASAGWELERVHAIAGSPFKHIVAAPASGAKIDRSGACAACL